MDKSRRSFLKRNYIGSAIKLFSDIQDSFKEGESDSDYFKSYESSYPLISEYSYFLEDEVKELEIDITGKSKLEVVEMVYDKKRDKSSKLSNS
jgi:hypothetical protein